MKLTDIHSSVDIKSLAISELPQLASDLRNALLEKLSRTGGHIGPNLGVLELTLALHYVFNPEKDKIIYDVSHQSYVHKMLTGRIDAYIDPAKYHDVTGYTNPAESPTDIFTVGHTSTAVSLAGGLAKARDLKREDFNVIAIVGDGSLSGGEAFEGLDYAATLNSNFIIVVNDNDMSIAENHGGIYDGLRALRESDGNASENIFKAMGLDYVYVAQGNDVEDLVKVFEKLKGVDHPVVVHVNTQKGKGLPAAEAQREKFHYNGPFNRNTGELLNVSDAPDYASITAEYMLAMMKQDPSVAVITAGTPGVLGFTPEKRKEAGKQFIDVGIAEQEAVALASGMAKGGAKPMFGVVSSFIQRAYDQLSQDVAINSSPAVFNIFYGGICGMTDVTHLGWFDIALISNIPGFVYLAPTNVEEYLAMLDWAMNQDKYPVAIRVPGGDVISTGQKYTFDASQINKFEVEKEGDSVAIIGAGTFLTLAQKAASILEGQGLHPTVINPRVLSGLDADLLEDIKKNHSLVITLEDGVIDGGFGQKVAEYYGLSDMKVKCYGVKKEFRDNYTYDEILKENHLTPQQIADDILAALKG